MASLIEVKLREKAIANLNAEQASQTAQNLLEAIHQTPGWKAYEQALESARLAGEIQQVADAALRSEMLNYFTQTGDKKPTPGIEVRLFKRIQYDQQAAIDWARVNAPKLVETRLAKEFDKVAVQLGAPVEEVYEPRVVVATNLRGYLPPELLQVVPQEEAVNE